MGLLDLFKSGKPAAAAPLGTGMAAEAAKILQSRPYQLHVQEAQAMGQQPLSPEEFMKMMQSQQVGLLNQ